MTDLKIQPENVTRDKHGFWRHSMFPDHELSDAEWSAWCKSYDVKLYFVEFYDDATEDVINQYMKGDSVLPDWQPTTPNQASALLSIHDTDNGPCAIFALPKDKTFAE